MAGDRAKRTRHERVLAGFLILLFFTVIAQSAALLPVLGAGQRLVDFDAFYIVGQLVAQGRASDAYDPEVMSAIQRELVGHDGFMPWTYPPQFDLITAALPLLPRGVAYVAFTGITLVVWLVLLARLAGPVLGWVLLALLPPIHVGVTIGQNAFLTGALMAGFALLTLRGRDAAGWPLGLLVIKPHLGVGLGLHALASGRWRVVALALAIALASSLLATLVFGPGIWSAFRAGVDAAGQALARGFYPLYRMTSVYALLHTLGLPTAVALAVQIGVALGASGLVVLAVRRGMAPRRTLAIAVFSSVLVSPYLYDYDMAILGVGLALIGAEVMERTGIAERLLLLALIWVAGGWGMIHALSTAGMTWEDRLVLTRATLSLGAVAYLLLLALLARILARPAPAQAGA